MTGLKRKPSQLPGDQPPPKLLKQNTSTTLDTAFGKESDIDNVPPPVLEKADSCIENRPIAVPYTNINDNGSSTNSTPPPILPCFPTLTPTNPTNEKYFGFEIDESDEEDDSISKIAQSINIGEDSLDNDISSPVCSNEPKTSCIAVNTNYDEDSEEEEKNKTELTLKKDDTLPLKRNESNGENKKIKLVKKSVIKKVISPKKSMAKKDVEIKKEKSIILDSLKSLKTIQKMPSGAVIEKIMKFGEQEIMLPSDQSLALYEDDSAPPPLLSSSLPRPSFQVVSETLQSIEQETTPTSQDNTLPTVDESSQKNSTCIPAVSAIEQGSSTTAEISGLPRLDCVSSEELTVSEQSDMEANIAAPTLQKICIATPSKSPKKYIHGGIREIVFSFDTTGSMYSYMEEAKDNMRDIIQRLKIDIPGVRVAFIAHGDYYDLKNDRYLIKSLDFGATVDEICNFFEYLPITHGGDADECYELVLRKVQESLSWTTGSQRCLVMIGDSDPHEPGYKFEEFVNDIDWKEETKKLNEMGVRIYGMQVGYRSDFYKEISQMTGGAHLRLESAEKTPNMLLAVCLREGNLKLLKTYEGEVMKGELDLELARLFSSLKNIPDNIAMKFKTKLLEGEENGKKAVKRSNDSNNESPGSKIAKLAKKALAEDGKKMKRKLSPDGKKKQKPSDKIAKNLIKKAISIKGTKDKKTGKLVKDKKSPLSKEKKKLLLQKQKLKEKKKLKLEKDKLAKKKLLKSGLKKTKTSSVSKLKDSKLKKSKQTATNLKAKAVVKAILKKKPSATKTMNKSVINKSQSKLKTPIKGKKTANDKKSSNKQDNKKSNLSKAKLKNESNKKSVKTKGESAKNKTGKKVETKKIGNKTPKSPEKKTKATPGKEKATKEKKTPVKSEKPKKATPKKTAETKPVKLKKPKDLPPREIASIAKFVTGPLSSLSWENWIPLIAHEKQKTGNWTKGKSGCPGYCNADFDKDKIQVPTVYEFAVSPPDSSKKYPVFFHSESDNVWEMCKNSYVKEELNRVIKGKGSISVRKGTLNRDDDALFLKTIEHLGNMFDYAWISNSSKDTARKQDLVKEGFIVAKV